MTKKTQRRNIGILIVAIAVGGTFSGLLLFGDASGVVTGNVSKLAFVENNRALNCEAFNQLAVSYTGGTKQVIGTAGREGFNPLVSDTLSFTADGRDVEKFHVQLILNCQGDLMKESDAVKVDGFTNFRLCGDPSNSGTKCFVGDDRTFISSPSGALGVQTSASVLFAQKTLFDDQNILIQEFDFSDKEIEAVFPEGTSSIHFKSEMLPVLNIRMSHPQFGNIVSTYDSRTTNDIIIAQYGGFANPFGDADGDGIADNVDSCVGSPEDFNGFEDTDGCPDANKLLDTDGDGILDGNDLCVTQPETVNQFEDDDGCPDQLPLADTDGDGIADNLDECPSEAENINGFQDADGCPDVDPSTLTSDADGDGVINANDLCPNTPSTETVDADGCPLSPLTVVEPVQGVDTDGDGILDVDDVCINDFGTIERNGCPENPFDQLVDVINPPDPIVDPIDPLFDPTTDIPQTPTQLPPTRVTGEVTDNDITILIGIMIAVALIVIIVLSATKKIKI